MNTYSIVCHNVDDRRHGTEVRSFADDASAVRYVMGTIKGSGRVDIWRGGALIHRSCAYRQLSVADKAEASAQARQIFLDVDRARSSRGFDFLTSAILKRVNPVSIPVSVRFDEWSPGLSFSSYAPTAWPLLEPRCPKQ